MEKRIKEISKPQMTLQNRQFELINEKKISLRAKVARNRKNHHQREIYLQFSFFFCMQL
jgi:hypothetical protein